MPTIEDGRGVDVSQIRRQLRMSVDNRVRHMADVTNKLMEVVGNRWDLLGPPSS
ncbi:MAG: hypothetical protein WD023_05880 [Ilumatobacteraceae bacterium]